MNSIGRRCYIRNQHAQNLVTSLVCIQVHFILHSRASKLQADTKDGFACCESEPKVKTPLKASNREDTNLPESVRRCGNEQKDVRISVNCVKECKRFPYLPIRRGRPRKSIRTCPPFSRKLFRVLNRRGAPMRF